MQVAHSFLGGGSAETGLIVNCECGFYDDYDVWRIRAVGDIETEGGFFTLGEAATATVVTRSGDADTFEFYSRTYGEYGDLAMVPIVRSRHYTRHTRQPDGPMRFFTHSGELTFNGFRIALHLMKKADPLRGRRVDAFVPHAGAAPSIDLFVKAAGLESSKLIMSYHDYGNTVAASIPLGLSLAVRDGRIARGDAVFAPAVAAGISIVSVFFTY
jgi:3-oxoacyl-[acyl-carrier-protein] synthase III